MSGAGVDAMGVHGMSSNFYFMEGRTPKPLTKKEKIELELEQGPQSQPKKQKQWKKSDNLPVSLHTIKKLPGFVPGSGVG